MVAQIRAVAEDVVRSGRRLNILVAERVKLPERLDMGYEKKSEASRAIPRLAEPEG